VEEEEELNGGKAVFAEGAKEGVVELEAAGGEDVRERGDEDLRDF